MIEGNFALTGSAVLTNSNSVTVGGGMSVSSSASVNNSYTMSLSQLDNSGNLMNDGFLNISGNFNHSGVLNNNATGLHVAGNMSLTGAGILSNSATATIDGSVSIASSATVSNSQTLTVGGWLSNDGKIDNNGSVDITGSFTQGGSFVNNRGKTLHVGGSYSLTGGSAVLSNSSGVSVDGSLGIASGGTVNNTQTLTALSLDNDGIFNNDGQFHVTSDYGGSGTFNNTSGSSVMDIDGNLNLDAGAILNNSLSVAVDGSMSIASTASVSNSNTLNIGVSLSHAGQIVNSGIIFVQTFSNSGAVNFTKQSAVLCENFYSTSNGSSLTGPADILDGGGHPDDANYAQVIVYTNSYLNGNLSGYLQFLDISYDGVSSPVKSDSYNTVYTSVGPNVQWQLDMCNPSFNFGLGFQVSPDKTFYCNGENVAFTYTSGSYPVDHTTWVYSGTVTSGVSALYSPSISLNGLVTCGVVTFTALVHNNFHTCVYLQTFSISVGNATVAVTSPVYFAIGNNVTLSSTVSSGYCTCQYTWQPNMFFNSGGNTVANPTVVPQVSMIYTVSITDSYGCTGSNTLMVIAQPYALLDKNLNGEYYNLFNDQLLFKYDGQYDNTSLVYNVYNQAHAITNSSVTVSTTYVVPGDNRYVLNASSLSTGQYYVLEVINEKKERLYLRFKK
jgi:hypothetical protein